MREIVARYPDGAFGYAARLHLCAGRTRAISRQKALQAVAEAIGLTD